MSTPNNGINGTLGTGLIGHWNFDGDLQDMSGNNKHFDGTFIGGVDKDSNLNKACIFNNKTDVVTLFPEIQDNGRVIFSCWMNFSDINTTQVLALFGESLLNGGGLYIKNGYLCISSASSEVQSPISLNTNTWHNLYISIKLGSGSYVDWYLDGDFKGQTIAPTFQDWYPYNPRIFLGWSNTLNYEYPCLGVLLDEIRLYNRELTTNEISEIYSLGVNYDKSPSPTIQPDSGNYFESLKVTIYPPNLTDYTVFYTTDGSTPTYASANFIGENKEINITTTTTIKSFSYRSGYVDSEIMERSYIIIKEGDNMSGTVENNQLVNVNQGTARVTAIVADLGADGKSYAGMSIYSCVIGSPDSGIAYPVSTILPQNSEINDMYSRGNFIGATLGNETLQEMTVSMSFINDFVYKLTGQSGSAFMNNILVNLLKGESIKDGGKVYKVYGTNGVKKTGKLATKVTNLEKLFKKDGEMVIPQAFSEATGKPLTQPNTRVTAYNNKSICIMIEHLTSFDATNKQGLRYVYTMTSNFTMTENDDVNKISFDAMFLSDAKNTESFFIDGFSTSERDVVSTSETSSVYKVNADYIIKNNPVYSTGTIGIADTGVVTGNGTTFTADMVGGKLTCEGITYDVATYSSATSITVTPAPSVAVTAGKTYTLAYEKSTPDTPSFSGTIGQIAVRVSPLNGKVFIYKYSGSGWTSPAVTSALGEGCIITSNVTGTSVTTLPATAGRSFVFVGTAGTTGNAVAIAEKTGTPTYVWDVKDFDFATQTFVAYTN